MTNRVQAFPSNKVIDSRSSPVYSGYNEAPWLSIKCMFRGSAFYEVDNNRHFVVDNQAYLILNKDCPYWVHRNSDTPVETFCIFFPPNWIDNILSGLETPVVQLLDTPISDQIQSFGFFEQRYVHNTLITPYLLQIHTAFKGGTITDIWLEETCYQLLTTMIYGQLNIYQEIEQLHMTRGSTWVELYQRLQLARDYMHAHLDDNITIAEIAKNVHLSPYHFLRTFKQIFGQTPHSYLTKERLKKAKFLLINTGQSVTDICFAVGFQSLPSFINLFRRNFDRSPTAFRKQQDSRISDKKSNFR